MNTERGVPHRALALALALAALLVCVLLPRNARAQASPAWLPPELGAALARAELETTPERRALALRHVAEEGVRHVVPVPSSDGEVRLATVVADAAVRGGAPWLGGPILERLASRGCHQRDQAAVTACHVERSSYMIRAVHAWISSFDFASAMRACGLAVRGPLVLSDADLVALGGACAALTAGNDLVAFWKGLVKSTRGDATRRVDLSIAARALADVRARPLALERLQGVATARDDVLAFEAALLLATEASSTEGRPSSTRLRALSYWAPFSSQSLGARGLLTEMWLEDARDILDSIEGRLQGPLSRVPAQFAGIRTELEALDALVASDLAPGAPRVFLRHLLARRLDRLATRIELRSGEVQSTEEWMPWFLMSRHVRALGRLHACAGAREPSSTADGAAASARAERLRWVLQDSWLAGECTAVR